MFRKLLNKFRSGSGDTERLNSADDREQSAVNTAVVKGPFDDVDATEGQDGFFLLRCKYQHTEFTLPMNYLWSVHRLKQEIKRVIGVVPNRMVYRAMQLKPDSVLAAFDFPQSPKQKLLILGKSDLPDLIKL